MDKPAAYPNTDTDEVRAVNLVNSVLEETGRFKCAIEKRDKVPNSDGTIELVDGDNIPVGKLEVQVKKIAEDKKSFSFERKYYEYSKTLTAPFLLICVDVEKGLMNWRHIHSLMPEVLAAKEQQSWTIKFSANDQIDPASIEKIYAAWKRIIDDYLGRVNEYPRINEELGQMTLDSIDRDNVVFYQRMIIRANCFFDQNFRGIKTHYFPGLAQLGLALPPKSSNQLAYILYGISFGAPLVLIRSINENIDFLRNLNRSKGQFLRKLLANEKMSWQNNTERKLYLIS